MLLLGDFKPAQIGFCDQTVAADPFAHRNIFHQDDMVDLLRLGKMDRQFSPPHRSPRSDFHISHSRILPKACRTASSWSAHQTTVIDHHSQEEIRISPDRGIILFDQFLRRINEVILPLLPKPAALKGQAAVAQWKVRFSRGPHRSSGSLGRPPGFLSNRAPLSEKLVVLQQGSGASPCSFHSSAPEQSPSAPGKPPHWVAKS